MVDIAVVERRITRLVSVKSITANKRLNIKRSRHDDNVEKQTQDAYQDVMIILTDSGSRVSFQITVLLSGLIRRSEGRKINRTGAGLTSHA